MEIGRPEEKGPQQFIKGGTLIDGTGKKLGKDALRKRLQKEHIHAVCAAVQPADISGVHRRLQGEQRVLHCRVGPHPFRNVQTRHIRQTEIAQHDIRAKRYRCCQSGAAGVRDPDVQSFPAQEFRRHVRHKRVVFHEQQADRRPSGRVARRHSNNIPDSPTVIAN